MVKVTIPMASRADGDALKRSLEDPTVRAVTVVCGVLLELPSIEQRRAVLALVGATVAGNGMWRPPEIPAPRPLDELPGMRLGLDGGGSARDTGE